LGTSIHRAPEQWPEQQGEIMADTNTDRLREGYDSFNRGDIAAVLELLDKDIEWHEPEWVIAPAGGTKHGRDQVLRDIFETTPENWDGFLVEPREVYEVGDTVIAEGAFKVQPKGGGTWLTVPFAHIWRFRNGKAISLRAYLDVKELRELSQLRKAA
jgi:ketosteroid isomerase-like protein